MEGWGGVKSFNISRPQAKANSVEYNVRINMGLWCGVTMFGFHRSD